jgi:hypothetical protein
MDITLQFHYRDKCTWHFKRYILMDLCFTIWLFCRLQEALDYCLAIFSIWNNSNLTCQCIVFLGILWVVFMGTNSKCSCTEWLFPFFGGIFIFTCLNSMVTPRWNSVQLSTGKWENCTNDMQCME